MGAPEQSTAATDAHLDPALPAPAPAQPSSLSSSSPSSAEQLRAITDELPVLIAYIDAGERYRFNSAAYERWYGRPRGSFEGRTVRETVGEQSYPSVRPHIAAALEGKRSTFEGQMLRDGSPRDVVVEFIPHLDSAGRVEGFYMLATDVTERRQLERALAHAQKMEVIGTLASGVAHDFNNLLMGILGCAEIALGRLDAGSPAAEFVEAIRAAARGGAALVAQLLAFSRKRDAQAGILDLGEVVLGAERMLRSLIGGGVDLRVAAPRGALVRWDPVQVEQVLMNLASNARHAMPGGGELRIEVATAHIGEQDRPRVGGLAPGEYVTLRVRDTGCGMDEHVIERAFEPFFTTKGPGEGTGLGLSNVYALVRQHGGHATIESKVGAGTAVTIYLPQATPAAAPSPPPSPSPSRSPSPPPSAPHAPTVLLVEDDPLARRVSRVLLEDAGFAVVAAGTGAEAERSMREHAVDVVLTDLQLPDTSGRALAAALRALRPELGVVFVSGHDIDHPEVAAAMREHGAAFIPKPVDMDQVTAALRGALARGAATS